MSFKGRETAKVMKMELKKCRSQGDNSTYYGTIAKTFPPSHQTID